MQIRMTDTAVHDLDLNILRSRSPPLNCKWAQPRRCTLGRECFRGKEALGDFFLFAYFCYSHDGPPKFVLTSEYCGPSADSPARALATSDGHEIWSFNTAQTFTTVNNVGARGGAISAPGPTIVQGMLFVGSGYAVIRGQPGKCAVGLWSVLVTRRREN